MTIVQLTEIGATYTPSKDELKIAKFENKISSITKIKFSIGGFLDGHEIRTITLDEKYGYMNSEESICFEQNFDIISDYPMNKEDFLDSIRELHIGEWKTCYTLDRFGYSVCDGTQWNLEIYFSNINKPLKIWGDNSYPYNFNELLNLFEIEYDY